MTSLIRQLKNCYFADGANSTKVGMIDYLFENGPRYLLVDEVDKMSGKDQAFLLNHVFHKVFSDSFNLSNLCLAIVQGSSSPRPMISTIIAVAVYWLPDVFQPTYHATYPERKSP